MINSYLEKYSCCRGGNMTHTNKGPGCPRTCKYPNGEKNCPVKFVEGCQCKPGYVQSTDKKGNVHCIKPEECKVCKYRGLTFVEGEWITYNCKKW